MRAGQVDAVRVSSGLHRFLLFLYGSTSSPLPRSCVVTLSLPPPNFPPSQPLLPQTLMSCPMGQELPSYSVGQIMGQLSPWGSPCERAHAIGESKMLARPCCCARRLYLLGGCLGEGWVQDLEGLS